MRYLSNLARHACLASLASAALLGAPGPAEAQSAQSAQSAPPQAQAAGAHRERARALANRGFELFEAGQYAEALPAFQAAEAEFHAPTILLMIARTQVRLGRLVDAHASYERIATEQLASYAPPEFFEAQTTARAELAEISKRTPTVEVIVRGAGAQGARVAVDGVEVAAGRRVPQNPGTHTVSVRAPGAQEVLREVTITEGAAERVEVDLGSSSGPAGGAPAGDEGRGGGGDGGDGGGGSLVPAWIAFGVAGVGIGVGAVTGAMTFGRVGELEVACQGGRCPPAEAERYDSAHTLATVSTVGFVIGGIAAATGAVLVVVRPGGRPAEQVGMVVAPGWVGLRGGF